MPGGCAGYDWVWIHITLCLEKRNFGLNGKFYERAVKNDKSICRPQPFYGMIRLYYCAAASRAANFTRDIILGGTQ